MSTVCNRFCPGLGRSGKRANSKENSARVQAAIRSDLVLIAVKNRWKIKWNKIETNIRHTAVILLPYCEEYFPNIKILLKLFATLSVSIATAEKSFSTLRRLKNYKRSAKTESKQNDLALLNVYKDKYIDIDIVVDQFARKKKRRKQLEDWSI
ncbi:52 kDa repressor of the inhibitor of the protein kinase-like [Sipha flava]|uniref:52 kDa repressor of the inhibitor of the protein kinase-like n=1 Tax=Sipha flava TaxID=143950 RepID=A0A8B8G9L1_9HEMI|nr:52 kDa repressor of the inhibitor of the protein kinase-like [Sipha flava]